MTKTLNEATFKQEVGLRLKKFREFLRKSKDELAKELRVDEITISNIENGKIFPGFTEQYYLFTILQLNINWLIMGSGQMIITPREKATYAYSSKIISHMYENDPMYAKYQELLHLMQIPDIEIIILAKIVELKLIYVDIIKEFFSTS